MIFFMGGDHNQRRYQGGLNEILRFVQDDNDHIQVLIY